MSLWSSDKAFRIDYEKRILQSLDIRQLSRDGRMRNPDEKPLLEAPKPDETDTLAKTNVKQPKEESKSPPLESIPPQKVQKDAKNKGKDLKSNVENQELAETDDFEYEKPQKVNPVKEPEIDPAKLKELKREEEIAKAKQALERKKKFAEKAAAKAAIRAQKEAEKKLKEREKKSKKKAAASASAADTEEATDAVVEATEPEKANETAEATLAPGKEKVQKESTIRSRVRTKGPESIPKVILKRKRSNNYWVWIACAALLVVLVLILGYNYLV